LPEAVSQVSALGAPQLLEAPPAVKILFLRMEHRRAANSSKLLEYSRNKQLVKTRIRIWYLARPLEESCAAKLDSVLGMGSATLTSRIVTATLDSSERYAKGSIARVSRTGRSALVMDSVIWDNANVLLVGAWLPAHCLEHRDLNLVKIVFVQLAVARMASA